MKRPAFITALLMGLAAASPHLLRAQEDQGEQERALTKARTASTELLSTLRGLMGKALAAGGPVSATSVCADSAQVVGARLQRAHSLSIRRVSERWRNPKDAPDDHETVELTLFAKQLATGVPGDSLESVKIVGGKSGRVLRFMKPIIVTEMCLKCHGTQMKPGIDEVLQLRYPDDKAVGYRVGELRGAVSVTVPLE